MTKHPGQKIEIKTKTGTGHNEMNLRLTVMFWGM